MNTKRKLLCVTVLTMLLLVFTAGSAFADGEQKQAQIGEKTYATLDAAISEAQKGDVITLLTQDAILSTSTCKQITIRTGDGHNIKQTGTVVLENVTIIGEDTGRVVMSVFGNLTLGKNVNITQIDGASQPAIHMGPHTAYNNACGELVVTDGATISSSNSRCIDAGGSSNARTYIYGGSMNNSVVGGGGAGAELIVKGGTIQKIDGYSGYSGKILISGGTISTIWNTGSGGAQIFSCCQRDAATGVVSHTSPLEANGESIYHCATCGGDYTNPQGLQAVLPQAVSAHNTTFHEAVEQTCTTPGNIAYYSCSNCGLNFEDKACSKVLTNITINALGHTPVTDAAVAATCTATGLTQGSHCSVCETVLTAQTTVNALGHDWGSWTKVDSTTHKRICRREGCTAEETAAHTFQNRTCTDCGYTKPSDHDYSGSSSGSSTVVKPTPSVPQAPAQTGYIQLTVDSLQASVFGTPVMLDSKPFIQSDRTMVPVRFVAEHMGCMVEWNEELQQVNITRPGSGVITLTIGQIPEGFDAAPVIRNDRTMVPIRYISELLGYHVSWDGAAETVTIAR